MLSRLSRHLDPSLFETRVPVAAVRRLADTAPPPPLPPPEFNWRDRAIMLLHVASRIEHALMVQYLFAGYSLGGPAVPSSLASDVRQWQETILGVAKEEMGHLITVQNVLTSLGAPLELDRDDLPFDTAFYPFGFSLEPLTPASLAKYVVAESPPGEWSGKEADTIRALAAEDAGGTVIEVGLLYGAIGELLADPARIPSDAFHGDTLPYQASWDEWGRGYGAGARGIEAGNVPLTQAPNVLVLEAYSRETAVHALLEVGEQGEGDTPVAELLDQPSHFERFLDVFRELSSLSRSDLSKVVRPVASNPTTNPRSDACSLITDPAAVLWAHLLNLRYRMLLVSLAHAFRLAGPATSSPRGLLIHRTFAEMYNVRAISGKLVGLPLAEGGDADSTCAGPPFQMPYTLELPPRARDRARLHRDLIEASAALIERLCPLVSARDEGYLDALAESDTTTAAELARLEPAT